MANARKRGTIHTTRVSTYPVRINGERPDGGDSFFYLPELVARCAGHSIAGHYYYSSAVVEV